MRNYSIIEFIKTITCTLILIVIFICGYKAFTNKGFEFRKILFLSNQNNGDVTHTQFHEYSANHFFPCMPKEIYTEALSWQGFIRCQQSKLSNNIDIAIIGDSHAEHLFVGLAETLPTKNVIYYLKPGYPFLGNNEYSKIFQYVANDQNIKTVIITMLWSRIENMDSHEIENKLTETANYFLNSGKTVYFTDDTPQFSFDSRKCKGSRNISMSQSDAKVCRDMRYEKPHTKLSSVISAANDSDQYFAVNKAIRKNDRVNLIRTYEYFCDAKGCSMADGDNVLFRDTNHLNVLGSRFISGHIISQYPNLAK